MSNSEILSAEITDETFNRRFVDPSDLDARKLTAIKFNDEIMKAKAAGVTQEQINTTISVGNNRASAIKYGE